MLWLGEMLPLVWQHPVGGVQGPSASLVEVCTQKRTIGQRPVGDAGQTRQKDIVCVFVCEQGRDKGQLVVGLVMGLGACVVGATVLNTKVLVG